MTPQEMRPFEAFRQGYRAGFEYYVRNEGKGLFNYLLGKSEDRVVARELADNVLKFCFKNAGIFRDEAQLLANLVPLARAFFEAFRLGQEGHDGNVDLLQSLDKEYTINDDDELARREILAALEALRMGFRGLTVIRRRVLVFYFRRKMKTRAIAEKLGIAAQTALNHKSQALGRLKEQFGQDWDKIFPLLYS